MSVCAIECACRCQQPTCGCHEPATATRKPFAGPSCGICGTTKQRFGTAMDLCPECDFRHCANKDCRRVVRLLTWLTCPHCGTHC